MLFRAGVALVSWPTQRQPDGALHWQCRSPRDGTSGRDNRPMIRLLVGLGNPGPEYEATRHNAGFWWIDAVARQLHATLAPERGAGQQQGSGTPKAGHGGGSSVGGGTAGAGFARAALTWIFIIARSMSPASSRSSAVSERSIDRSMASRSAAGGLRST